VCEYKWYLVDGYAKTTFHRKGCSRKDKHRNINIRMAHLILENKKEGYLIDHINRNTLDNRGENLRLITYKNSLYNTSIRKNKKIGGYKGVIPVINKFAATFDKMWLGVYKTAKEAAMAYDKAARKYAVEYANLNFPDLFYDKPVRYVDFMPVLKGRKSKYMGVSFFKGQGPRKKPWRAVFRSKHLGYFHTEEEASEQYKKARCEYENKKNK
jgi:hypothetical protein